MQKNNTPSASDVPLHPAVDPELESRVDAMMAQYPEESATLNSDSPVSEKAADEPSVNETDTLPPIDIFNDPKTAPEVPPELAKEMAVDPNVTEPLAAKPAESTLPEDTEVGTLSDALEDAETDKAIDDITRSEADKALEANDTVIPASVRAVVTKPKRPKSRLRRAWSHRWVRVVIVLLMVASIASAAAWPTSRYYVLNTAGVRSAASMTIVDATTGLPLKNATVRLGSATEVSDETGVVQFSDITLGEQELVIERVAFAPLKRTIVIGWGSNPLGEQEITATGVQYVFDVTDYLSGGSIEKAEATSGDATAVVDEDGKITLTVEDPASDTLEVTITAPDYRSETIEVPVTTTDPITVRMVASKPVVYLTKESGTYDLYKMDLDGKNKQLLLADVGDRSYMNQSAISLLVSNDGSLAALVSNRDKDKRSSSGNVLAAVTVVETATGKLHALDYADIAMLVSWHGNQLTYLAQYEQDSKDGQVNQRLITYDFEREARIPLLSTVHFPSVLYARGYIYYAITNEDDSASFARIKPDGSDRKVFNDKKVWFLTRSSGTTVSMQSSEGGMILNLNSQKLEKETNTPENRMYVDGANGQSLWIDERDGKQVLLKYDYETGQDTVVTTLPGMVLPVRWLNQRTVVAQVLTPTESAIYAISLDGGDAQKVTDATRTLVSYTGM